jgi:predicted enzyme related to lactoylglutathione lyase
MAELTSQTPQATATGEVTSHAPGTFCWVDLATTDQKAAVSFYRGLFGWGVNDMPMGPGETYSMFQIGGKDVAAAATMRPEQRTQGVPPHWMSYVLVTSADDVARRATELGGKVLAQPFDVFDAGRMAVLQDPTAAPFSVWQPKTHIGAKIINQPNTLCWNELATRDTGAAERFYTKLFGWTTKASSGVGVPYTEFLNQGKSFAGMMSLPPQAGDAPPFWMPYFAVTDCDKSASRAKELGAALMMPPTDIPKVGRFAVIRDPQGAHFAIIRLTQQA